MKPTPPTPPRWAARLLERFGHPDTLEEVQGDLLELYTGWAETLGVREARRRYVLSALKLLRPLARPSRSSSQPSPSFMNPDMLLNYFKVSRRNLVRHKAFSFINILGLALGMAASLLILLWVQDERSVDGFHANGPHLYQIYERRYYDGKEEANYFTQGLLAQELKRVIPEVQYASSLEWNMPATFEAGETIARMDGSWAGEDFFRMFSYPLLEGTPETALGAPGGIAVSRKMAEQFFGSADRAIGRIIRYENRDNLKITAVFENLPANSSQQFDFLRTWKDYVKENKWVYNWGNTNPLAFVQLRPDRNGNPADAARVEAKIRDFIYRYLQRSEGLKIELALQPYSEKYLHSTFKAGKPDGGRIEYVRLFTLVAAFILLIACINFMNLATARSTKRAKEVGVRKVVGAVRSALVGQFVGEALLLTFFSIGIAVALVALLLPAFNAVTGKQLALPVDRPAFWAAMAGLLLLTGLVAGSYPAFFLSSLRPVRVLKGSLKFGQGATVFRKGLVVFQFGLSILLIVGTLVIHRQMEYVRSKNLGYDRENLIYIPIEGELTQKFARFREEAGHLPGIRSVSKMKESPTGIGHHTGDIFWEGKDPNLIISFANTAVGYDFLKTMNLQLKEGRDFSRAFGTDSTSYLMNESALKKIGYKDPVGKPLTWGNRKGRIIGIVKDFHFTSMHQAIEPLVIRLNEEQSWGTILVRTEAGKTREALAGLEKVCRELNPKFPFNYRFSDLEYARLYRSEEVVSRLAVGFAALAIFISCLGLFGLAAFTAEQRTKEIGVRKVLGASVTHVVAMLSGDFLKLVGISIVVASPVAWWAMNRWLQDFAYKTGLDWWLFALAGGAVALIALLTVSYQSIRAALTNPVKSLRSE
ncbi:ABC transporter permease [Larkinella soli]|uniref:ABC transporter permease n=1 Tax=Larkinella soli TaxID=1770527 RepID=UPI001E422A1E|nr:ABC transporter permease [Larkinella soli]